MSNDVADGCRRATEIARPPRTIVFDLDGTLADTSGDLIAAANSVFAARGEPGYLDPERDRATALKGGRAMLRLGYSRGGSTRDEAEDYATLLDFYARDIDRHTRLYPGAREAIENISTDGDVAAVCTNKPEALARELLSRLGVLDLFGALVGADTLPVRKPDRAPYDLAVTDAGGETTRSLLVGDTETDVATARAAGVPVVVVAFGPEGDRAGALGADRLLESFGDLQATARELLP